MKKFLSLLVLLFCTSLMYSQGPQTIYTQSYGPVSSLVACTAAAGVNTSATISPCGGEGGMYQNSLVTVQTINWTVVATVSTCTLELEQSTTGTGSWTLLGVQQTCTSSGSYTVTANAPYVRFNINSLTTSGSGSLTVNYFGQIATLAGPLPSIINCGTATACVPSANTGTFKVVYGTCTASAATTCTVTALPFTATASYNCTASDATTAANGAFKLTNASASSFVITTTSSSDAFNWVCVGT
jgi:hypothetical protein